MSATNPNCDGSGCPMTSALASFILARPFGFLNDSDLPTLVQLDRLCPVLVRCGGGRFTCAAQDAAHFIALVGRDERESVRDVSLLLPTIAEAKAWKACEVWQENPVPLAGCQPLPKFAPLLDLDPEPRPTMTPQQVIDATSFFDEADYGGSSL